MTRINSLLVRLIPTLLCACGGSSAGLEDAGAETGPHRVILAIGGAAADPLELAQADAGAELARAPSNGCGGCETLAYPPGTSCAGDFVGTCGICNWAVQCVYECTGPAITVRVCPNGLESCDGRP